MGHFSNPGSAAARPGLSFGHPFKVNPSPALAPLASILPPTLHLPTESAPSDTDEP